MPDGLTLKQATFAAEYVAKNGNGLRAAIAAGYSPNGAHVTAHRLLKKSTVKRRIERLVRKHEISAERVLTRLDNLSAKAEEAGNYPAAVRAEELIGKSLGMWVDRSVSVNLDLTGEHIAAVRALAARRIQKNTTRPGDDALDVSASTSGENAICHNAHYMIADGQEGEKSVIDQRTRPDVLTPSTLKQSSDVDE